MAILRFFVETGCRLGEVTGLTVEDVDLDGGVAQVKGKGSRTRWVPWGRGPSPRWTAISGCGLPTARPTHPPCGWASGDV
jgi:integrase/recombinase XerC